MFYTLSHDALHLCEILSKYLKRFQITELTRVHDKNVFYQYLLCSKVGTGNSKSRLTSTTVLVFCPFLQSRRSSSFCKMTTRQEGAKEIRCLQADTRQQEATIRQRPLQPFRCTGTKFRRCLFVCVEVLRPSQPNGVMSSMVSLPNHTFTGQA